MYHIIEKKINKKNNEIVALRESEVSCFVSYKLVSLLISSRIYVEMYNINFIDRDK